MAKNDGAFYKLPDSGLIYVDASGVSFDSSKVKGFSAQEHYEKMGPLFSFLEVAKKRSGEMSTVGSVLEEIKSIARYYKSQNKKAFRVKGKRWDGGISSYERREMEKKFFISKKGAKMFNRLCSILEEGMGDFNLPEDNSDFVFKRKFVDFFDEKFVPLSNKLSLPDKELISAALCFGEGGGIMASDRAVIRAYSAGVRKFELENCFVCDSLQHRSYFL